MVRSIRVRPSPKCVICGSAGDLIYEDLDDVLFGAPGNWKFKRCSNPQCRLLWLDPQPIEEDIGKAYDLYYTHHGQTATAATLPKRMFRQVRASYLRSRLGYEKATAVRGWRWLAPIGNLHPGSGDAFAATVMFLPAPNAGSSLLDIGCGGGDFISTMQELGWRVSGVETDPIAVGRALARGLDVHQGQLESAGFGDKSFDAITMAHVVEHVHDPRRLLAHCRRLLKPDGTVVIMTPNTASWGHRHFGRDWRGLEPPRHIHLFNPDNMRMLLESADLQPARIATLAINASAIWPTSTAIHRARSSPAEAREAVALKTTPSGVARQVAERLRLRVDPTVGEDLVAVATRCA